MDVLLLHSRQPRRLLRLLPTLHTALPPGFADNIRQTARSFPSARHLQRLLSELLAHQLPAEELLSVNEFPGRKAVSIIKSKNVAATATSVKLTTQVLVVVFV